MLQTGFIVSLSWFDAQGLIFTYFFAQGTYQFYLSKLNEIIFWYYMKTRSPGRTHSRQKLHHEFYEIHDAVVSQHRSPLSEQQKQQQSGSDEEFQLCDKSQMMKTTSTEVLDSKFGIWQQPTLRQIEEKSEQEENSNGSNSIKKYAFREKQYTHCKPILKEPVIKQPEQNNQVKRKKKKKKSGQLVVSLKYGGDSSNKTYRIGMKILNKEWMKALDNLHKTV